MPFIPAPNCALIEVLGLQAGQPCEFTCAAERATGYDLANMVTLAGAVDGWVNTDYLGIMGTTAMYEGVTIRGLEAVEDIRYDLSEPLPGSGFDEAMPAQVALVVTKRTGFTGRSQRGRLYCFGLDRAGLLDERHVTEDFRAGVQTAFDNFLTAVIGAGWQPVVLSYYHLSAPRVTAQIRPITSVDVRDAKLDTQRRRVGRG